MIRMPKVKVFIIYLTLCFHSIHFERKTLTWAQGKIDRFSANTHISADINCILIKETFFCLILSRSIYLSLSLRLTHLIWPDILIVLDLFCNEFGSFFTFHRTQNALKPNRQKTYTKIVSLLLFSSLSLVSHFCIVQRS